MLADGHARGEPQALQLLDGLGPFAGRFAGRFGG